MGRGGFGAWDWGVAAAVTGVSLVGGSVSAPEQAHLTPVASVLLAVAGMSLVARTRAPVVVLGATAACTLGCVALGLGSPASLAFLVAVCVAVRAGHRAVTVAVAVAMLVAVPLVLLVGVSEPSLEAALAQGRDALPLAWLVAAGAAGEALRQADRRADEAERTRDEAARHRAAQERLHLARELHDSLTHQISVIQVQSEVAVHLARKRGEEVPDALLAIRDAGRGASRDLRATLQALRDDSTHPPPGLDDLEDLVERARAAGLEASMRIDGSRHEVPGTVERTAYRIVQEALTNVARHASARTASVRVAYEPRTLVVQVDDDGPARAGAQPDTGAGAGVGLLGMQERVTALGGRLEAAPRPDGGFTVRAELPTDVRS